MGVVPVLYIETSGMAGLLAWVAGRQVAGVASVKGWLRPSACGWHGRGWRIIRSGQTGLCKKNANRGFTWVATSDL